MARMRISMDSSASFGEVFKSFLLTKKAESLAEKTLVTHQHLLSVFGKRIDLRECRWEEIRDNQQIIWSILVQTRHLFRYKLQSMRLYGTNRIN